VMEAGVVKGGVTGTPQGGVVSPVLCNIYLAPAGPGMADPRGGGAGAVRR
jgi:hypothetical protein